MTTHKRRVLLTLSTHLSQGLAGMMAVEAVRDKQLRLSDGNQEASQGRDNFGDVEAFHQKFGVPMAPTPAFLDRAGNEFRRKFMQEELDEYMEAYLEGDLPKAFDALLDLAYVALGTASMMGLPWQDGWEQVQRANMAKERAKSDGSNSKRGSALDVVKPAGWQPPDHLRVLEAAGWDIAMPTPIFHTEIQPPAMRYPVREPVAVISPHVPPQADSEGGET